MKKTPTGNTEIILMGNGPSLKELIDFGLENIPDNIDTFGLNAAYRYFNKVNWFPTYIGSFDSRVTPYHSHNILKMVENTNTIKFITVDPFLPKDLHGNENIEHLKDHRKYNPEWYTINRGYACSGHTAAKWCFQNGYKKIYLIGVDANYVDFLPETKRNSGGGLVIDKEVKKNPNYFTDDYQQQGDIYNIPHKNGHKSSWNELKENMDKNCKDNIEIINLNPKSEVKCFKFSDLKKELGDNG